MKEKLHLAMPLILAALAGVCAVIGFTTTSLTLACLLAGLGWVLVALGDLRTFALRFFARKARLEMEALGISMSQNQVEQIKQLWADMPLDAQRAPVPLSQKTREDEGIQMGKPEKDLSYDGKSDPDMFDVAKNTKNVRVSRTYKGKEQNEQ